MLHPVNPVFILSILSKWLLAHCNYFDRMDRMKTGLTG